MKADFLGALSEVLRISDRKHPAWDICKEYLAAHDEPYWNDELRQAFEAGEQSGKYGSPSFKTFMAGLIRNDTKKDDNDTIRDFPNLKWDDNDMKCAYIAGQDAEYELVARKTQPLPASKWLIEYKQQNSEVI